MRIDRNVDFTVRDKVIPGVYPNFGRLLQSYDVLKLTKHLRENGVFIENRLSMKTLKNNEYVKGGVPILSPTPSPFRIVGYSLRSNFLEIKLNDYEKCEGEAFEKCSKGFLVYKRGVIGHIKFEGNNEDKEVITIACNILRRYHNSEYIETKGTNSPGGTKYQKEPDSFNYWMGGMYEQL